MTDFISIPGYSNYQFNPETLEVKSLNRILKPLNTKIVINGKQIQLGYYNTADEASKAYQNKLTKIGIIL